MKQKQGILQPDRTTPEERSRLSLGNLIAAYEQYRAVWGKKDVAEVAFALALAMKREADSMGEGFKDAKDEYAAKAREYAADCIAILATLSSRTLCDVATSHASLVGVPLPNYFYREDVERRFRELDLIS